MDVSDHDEMGSTSQSMEQVQVPLQYSPTIDPEPQARVNSANPGTIAAARRAAQADIGRTRSPTPPRALFRSTTGKGVAFTEEDVTFLVRFLDYRHRSHGGKVDMIAFWKDVANKVLFFVSRTLFTKIDLLDAFRHLIILVHRG